VKDFKKYLSLHTALNEEQEDEGFSTEDTEEKNDKPLTFSF
jgi:hypothetical protein